jgi:competence protein ComEC
VWYGPAAAASVVIGTAAGLLSSWRTPDALAAALVAASLWVLAERRTLSTALALLAVLLVAIAHGAGARDHALSPPLVRWFDARVGDDDRLTEPIQIHGTLASDASAGAYGIRLLIDVECVRERHVWDEAAGRAQVTVSGELAGGATSSWRAGRTIDAPVLLRRPPVSRNPGGNSVAWQRLQRPFALAGTIKSAALVHVTPGAWWEEAAAAIRQRVRRSIARFVAPYDSQSAAVVVAILIGDRAGLDDEVEQRLQAAGTYHVIAISGGNVAVVAALALLGVRVLVRSGAASHALAALVVIGYGWVVGGEPSVARAVTAAAIYLSLGAIGLRPRPVPVLATVALILAAWDPLTVIDVGAWLSFGATLAIVLGAARFVGWVRSRGVSPPNLVGRVVTAALFVFAGTLAAELALLPIAAGVFGRVGVAGLVLNFVAIPAMTLVQVAGLATVLAAELSWSIASGAAAAAHLGARALLDSSRLLDVAPWLSWTTPRASIVWTAAYYACWGLLLHERGSGWRRRGLLAATGLAAAGLLYAPGAGAPPGAGRLRITWLDVGQADAALVQLPTGHALLVDAGGGSAVFDVGRRIVAPAARALGIRRLDWFLFTHADLDHAGGAVSTLALLKPREIWEGVPVPRSEPRRAIRDAAEREHVVWRRLSTPHAIDTGAVSIDVLHPPAADWERQRVRNDDSVVIRLRYGDAEVLLTGDAGAEFERAFAPDPAPLPLRVLKVAHHGSRSSTSEAFLSAYRPAVAVVSAGRGNLFGHPSREVLGRLAAIRAAIFRTDRDGAVTLETDGREVVLTTAAGRRRAFASGRGSS